MSNQKTTHYSVGLVIIILAITLSSCEGSKPGNPVEVAQVAPNRCFIDTITQPDISKTRRGNSLACTALYASACTDAAKAAQAKCDADCLAYTKRRPEDPNLPNDLKKCPADPVRTTIPAFDQKVCVDVPGSSSIEATCKVSYSCTCDP